MLEDLNFEIDRALLSNLSRLSGEESIIGEQRLIELEDIAVSLADISVRMRSEGLDAYELLSYLSGGILFGDYQPSDVTTEENASFIRKKLDTLARIDKAMLSELYARELKARGGLKLEDFLPSRPLSEEFTYVRNSLSDEAYDVFCENFTDPRVRYSATFRDCATAVCEGRASYCLLPLEERGGVRLPTVSEIIYRNDFKINSVTPVFGPDGTADMKYALLSRSFTVPPRRSEDDRYLEIRIGVDSSADLFFAVEYFGMSIYRVNTFTIDNGGESDSYISAVIREGDTDFIALFTYLTLFTEDFVPVGIYKNLE